MPKVDPPIRIGIYVMRFPVLSETFIVTKVLGLIDAGFDVKIFANRVSDDAQWAKFDILTERDDIRSRLVIGPPTHSMWQIVSIGLAHVIGQALRHPLSFCRYVRHTWLHRQDLPLSFLKALYSRAHFVGHRLDVLHGEFDTQALSIVDLKDYFDCQLVLSSRGTFQKTSVLDMFPEVLDKLYQKVDGYHFISEYLHNRALRAGLSSKIPVWLIPPAIDLELFEQSEDDFSDEREGPLRIISIGRLAWQKGYEFAIDAVALLHQQGFEVEYSILGGDDGYREPIIFAARQWGLFEDGIVRLMGVVPREDVPEELRRADIMLHLAVEEGFCNAVIEAQAMGVPVVASDAGGLPENVEDGVTGFVVPRRNPGAAVDKLVLLAADHALREQMGRAGQNRVRALFDLRQQNEAFARMYREVLGMKGMRA